LPRYFGYKRGITWLNAVNDQVAGIGQMVVPGTPRDSLHILDTLLNLDAGPKPDVVTTDTASYSDMIFGLFALLGYQFSPRFADLPDQRYWRAPLPDRLPDGIESVRDASSWRSLLASGVQTDGVVVEVPDRRDRPDVVEQRRRHDDLAPSDSCALKRRFDALARQIDHCPQ
jgi:Tn3 transposase DDE domain